MGEGAERTERQELRGKKMLRGLFVGLFVVPHKIDGSLTRSLSRGRGLGFWRVWMGFD
jgi:hypothetical protein